jgi:hypothetical protein
MERHINDVVYEFFNKEKECVAIYETSRIVRLNKLSIRIVQL